MDNFLMVLLVAVALGTDAFSLALGIGMSHPARNHILRTASVVGIFHILMPLAGVYVGALIGGLVGKVAVWVGGGILIILGLRMVWSGRPWRREIYSFREARHLRKNSSSQPVREWGGLLALSWSVSVDSFGAGIGLGAFMARFSYTVLILGVVAGLMTAAGLVLGRWFTRWVGDWAETIGGLVLTGIGLRLLF
ncbi:MAG: manganese efflux pump [Bacillota bacterium]|nr:manganese efflux pump [Bacillota bacterium]